MSVTRAQLRALVAYMKARDVKPKVVATEEQAREMSAKDPFGYIWSVGEEYYETLAP